MSLDHTTRHAPKTLGESAVCFGCAALGLAAFAVGLQWLFGLMF